MFQLVIFYVHKNEVFEEFIDLLDYHRNNYREEKLNQKSTAK